jgi:hypothetical protein
MPAPQFISRLNWRLIVVHLAACWLFINAFWMFSYLHDPELIAFVRDHRPPVGVDHKHNDAYLKEFDRFGSGRITYTLIWAAYGEMAALFLVIKKHWYWLNSLIVFAAFILFGLLKVEIWRYVGSVFSTPGRLFKAESIGYLLVNGLVMLGLGVLLFFSNKIIAFINSGWPKSTKVPLLLEGQGSDNDS